MQKSKKKKKKKKKKIFYGTFSLAIFLFPVIIRTEEVIGFVFSVRGEGKCEINYQKKEKFFSPLGSFFTIFGR